MDKKGELGKGYINLKGVLSGCYVPIWFIYYIKKGPLHNTKSLLSFNKQN